MKKKTKHFVYIIRAADGSYYTGMSKDVTNRLALHESGKGAKYLRGRTPLAMVYCEKCSDIKTAMVREFQIKKYSKKQKQKLIDAPPAKKRRKRKPSKLYTKTDLPASDDK
jgi:putative endonuclease